MSRAVMWDLSKLLPSLEASPVDAAVKAVEGKVQELEAWRSKLDTLQDPMDLERLFDLEADLDEAMQRLSSRGSLAFASDTGDEASSAFLARMENLEAEFDNRTRFLGLWWKALPEERARALMPRAPDLAHYARRLREFAPHTLSEAEERVASLKDVTGASALDKAREILTSRILYASPLTGKEVTQSELVRGVYHHDPRIREATYGELWRVWSKEEALLSHLYQTVVNDWWNEQVTLRKYADTQAPRDLYNDVPSDAVRTLLDVSRKNRGLFQRYFLWKGKRLGLAKMSRYHVYAPLSEQDAGKWPYDAAADEVLASFEQFDPPVAALAKRVFDEEHVDVLPRARKRGGAFCATVNSRMTPFLFLNHTGDKQSLKTLAHEMGHAVHSMLAEGHHPNVAHSGLPLAETASVFSEMLMHDRLVARATPAEREAIVSDKVGEIYATVMRQAYFARFEIDAHKAIREGATTQDVHRLYLENVREQFGPVEVPEEFRYEWTYIPHFYASPFYVYAYSFGMLLSLALYDMYRAEGKAFVPKYKRVLAAGGSESPEPLLRRELGVEIRDAAFWQRGFSVVEGMVKELGT
ncbi:MAG TPA: M3 family oligoendopeptidase [Candidatus Thermoplasmatota archaeon]|nr:M3 family oligoendopeptidase [Candidatus Thermoplasmatota archaeon]